MGSFLHGANMERTIPFIDWNQDVDDLLEIIHKCNFEVLTYAGSYHYGDLNITNPQDGLFVFMKTISGEKYKAPKNMNQYNVIAGHQHGSESGITSTGQISTLPSIVTTGHYTSQGYTIADKNLLNYAVTITCTKDRIVKLEVSEFWHQNFNTTEQKIHSVVFHDKDLLVNGKWYKIDSPEAFLHDVSDEEISILTMIEIFENFGKSLDDSE